MLSVGTYSNAFGRVDFQHSPDQVLCLVRQLLRHIEFADLDFGEESPDILIVEGEAASQEGKEDNTTRPDVGRSTMVIETRYYLR
jgi:hypothetical protein